MDQKQIEYYGDYADKLVECQKIMTAEINSIVDSLTTDPEHKPTEHILTRIKGADSLKEKQIRMDVGTGIENALTGLSDIIGCRIVTHFVGDVYDILEKMKQSDKWEVDTVKDYIKNSKPNGYRSLHVLVRMPFGVNGIDTILTEIQMRTIAMDCWAALEHQLKYKKKIDDIELMTEELKRCADEMAASELSMQSIRDIIKSSE